ncbi:MAG: NAD(+) diphosphatase, partial [Steroidobacteraceae bacterium]|nr:NAD(+) diphosphatase [Steroidobacteraceae bacterium]
MNVDVPRFHPLAGPYLDRRAEERETENWFDAALADEATRCIVAHRTAQLIHGDANAGDAPPRAALLHLRALPPDVLQSDAAVLLGWYRGARCVLLLTETPERFADHGQFAELRPLMATLDGEDAALLGYARALSYWRLRHRFCGSCGARTRPLKAGHVLRCSDADCSAEIFPRIDPAIIVLVTDPQAERALLGRQPSWPPGRYSTIAGFVEPGESLEDAVAREVAEETGVRIAAARYDSSQPWPFPSSLMLGFRAVAAAGAQPRGGG